MSSAAVNTVPEDDYVLAGNRWSKRLTFPAVDPNGTPLAWGDFTVTSPDPSDVAVATVDASSGPTVVTLTGTATGDVTWYLAESNVYGGNAFLRGTVHSVRR